MGYVDRDASFDEGCPLSPDNNLRNDPRYIEVTNDIGMSYLDVLKESEIDKILMKSVQFNPELLEFNRLVSLGLYFKPVTNLKE
jgi:hypothetical protein